MTPQQKKLHDFLWERRTGVMPTIEEMRDHLGLASKSGVSRLIDSLEEQGLVKRPAEGSRARRLTALPAPGALEAVPTEAMVEELTRRGWIAMPKPTSTTELMETMNGR